MDTPVYDFVLRYAQSGTLRFHMPGHKGRGPLGLEALDITEIRGADDLARPEGRLAASEANAASLFGSARTLYGTEGSSQCIKAMLLLALQWARAEGRAGDAPFVLAGRNAHKALLQGLALLGLEAEWLYPEEEGAGLWSCPISPKGLAARLAALAAQERRPVAVYVTSPDYLGGLAPLAGLAEAAHAAGIPLLVDNAHGAYLRFLPGCPHPLEAGADLACDSAHKTLPVLTGGAYLHLGARAAGAVGAGAKSAMALFGSSSPSYLTLASLDACNGFLAGEGPAKLAEAAARTAALRRRLEAVGLAFAGSEPLKLTLACHKLGLSGEAAAERLRDAGIEPEFASRDSLVCMVGPGHSAAELARLEEGLLALLPLCGKEPAAPLPQLPRLVKRLGLGEAVLAPAERVLTEAAVGRICAAPSVSCPPAIAIAVSGEELSPEATLLMLRCGIETVEVVRPL